MKKSEILRRNRLDLNIKSEKAILKAMKEVEKMPADTILTEALLMLSMAKDRVSFYIDNLNNPLGCIFDKKCFNNLCKQGVKCDKYIKP